MNLKSLFFQAFLVIFSLGNTISAAKLTIRIKNVKNDLGNMFVLLWDDPNRYLRSTPAKQVVASLVGTQGEIELVIDKLKKGVPYAIFAYHDENKTYSLNSNIVGVPTEGYAFGNSALLRLGPPTFKEVSVVIESDHSSLEMTITNNKAFKNILDSEAV